MKKRTRKREKGGGIPGGVLDGDFPKQPGFRVLAAVGASYSAVRGAIGLKLPSVAILPWVLGRLLRKIPIQNNARNPSTLLPLTLFFGRHYVQ